MKTFAYPFVFSLGIAATLSFVGCSSSSSSSSDDEEEPSEMTVISKYEDIPECTEELDGEMYYALDTQAAYTCLNSRWIKMKAEFTPPVDTTYIKDTTIVKDTTVIKDTTVVKDTTVIKDKVYMCGEDEYDPKNQSCFENDDIIEGICNKDKKGTIQKGASGQKYVCANNGGKVSWRRYTEVEEVLNSNECSSDKAGSTTQFGYSNYKCDAEKGWTFDYDNLYYGELTVGEQTYKTVGVGKQLWMAENLNYTDSTKHPNLKGNVSCYGNNEETSCEAAGAFYSWTAAMNFPESYADSIVGDKIKDKHQGICPEGWHIPSIKDWDMLNDFVIGTNEADEEAGPGLKATSSWLNVSATETDTVSGNGSNAYGFNAYATGSIKYTAADSTHEKPTLSSTSRGTYALFVTAAEIPCTYDYVDNGKCRDYLTPVRADLRYDKINLRYLQSDTYTRRARMSVRCISDKLRD